MLLVPTELRASDIEGIGVFALTAIRQGERIWQQDEEFERLITTEMYERYPPHLQAFIDRYCYPHPTRPNVLILEADNARFMNHSDRPNTIFTPEQDGFATCDIAPGEEITCNYDEFNPHHDLQASDATA